MKKTLIILLTAILALSLFISCEGDLDEALEAKITVTFDGNGSTDGEMAALKVKKGEDFKLTKNAFEKTDYIFTGWNTAADGSGTAYANEGTAKFDKDTTLYAQWIEELTITFNANNGSETPATKTQKVGKGVETALDENTFELSGFTFTKWNNEKDGSGTDYANGAVKTFDSDLELYAQWAANTDTPYVVNHYTKNLSDDKYTLSSTDNETDTTGVLLVLENLKKTIEGFTYDEGFAGTETKGTTKPSSGAVTEAAVLGEGNLVIDLYYSRDSHTVALTKGTDADHISAITGAGTYAYGASVSVEATIDSGYKLANWIVTGETTEVSTDNPYVFTMGASDVAYTANATPISYTVAFNKNNESATGTMESQSFTYGTAQNLTENGFQYGGKYFGGWATTTSGEKAYSDKQSVNNLTTTDGDTVTLYAIWTDTPPITIIKNTEGPLNLTSGDYTIEDATVTVTGRITIDGSVNLLLPDGMTLNANSGITVSSGNTLVIDKYGSTATGTGTLTADSGNFAAGIGGEDGGSGGTVIIKGGIVNANGGYGAAGIGGGYHGAGGPVNISGGTVTAYGGDDAAGIGGGSGGAGGNVTITRGTVTAKGGAEGGTGGDAGAGIGGGCNGAGGTVTINGGTVTATGGSGDMEDDGSGAGAGIGGGYKGAGGTVTINGGTVTATGGKGNKASSGSGAGIGAGEDCSSHGTLTIADDVIMMVSTNNTDWSVYDGSTRTRYMKVPEPTVLTSSMTSWEGGKVYTLGNEDLEIASRITVTGSVGLLLPEDKTLTASSGITVTGTNSLTINGKGSLSAGGSTYAAGIGGGNNQAGGKITINGGTVIATGGAGGAGIGGGYNQAGGTITINGGAVTANGGDRAAGIGGGYQGVGGEVTINGGAVTANGGDRAAGIGGGWEGTTGGTVTINGGTVEAIGGSNGAGIGGGYYGAGGTVTINNGTVTATGVSGGAGIGGGYYKAGGTVTISGGSVTANGGQNAHGIGRGYVGGSDGTLTLTGVTMQVKDSEDASWESYVEDVRHRYMKADEGI
jgi:hypothetical protein